MLLIDGKTGVSDIALFLKLHRNLSLQAVVDVVVGHLSSCSGIDGSQMLHGLPSFKKRMVVLVLVLRIMISIICCSKQSLFIFYKSQNDFGIYCNAKK